jgi:hypothetical protein
VLSARAQALGPARHNLIVATLEDLPDRERVLAAYAARASGLGSSEIASASPTLPTTWKVI